MHKDGLPGALGFNGAPDRNPGKDQARPRSCVVFIRQGWRIGARRAAGCFNGAPDWNPGKEALLAMVLISAMEFQWSPRLESGEGETHL